MAKSPIAAAVSKIKASAAGKMTASKTERKKVPSRDGLAKFARDTAKSMR